MSSKQRTYTPTTSNSPPQCGTHRTWFLSPNLLTLTGTPNYLGKESGFSQQRKHLAPSVDRGTLRVAPLSSNKGGKAISSFHLQAIKS